MGVLDETVNVARRPGTKIRGSASGKIGHPAVESVGVRFVRANWCGVQAWDAALGENGVDVLDRTLVVAGSVDVRARYCEDEGVLVEELHGVTEGLYGGRIDGFRARSWCVKLWGPKD